MIELIRHIELLLLENDCVVVPGFGGFITHHVPATWSDDKSVLFPPRRTIGFNPQLKMNDGTLVQSYMESYDTDFPDATRILQKEIEEFIELLHKEGSVCMEGIGELSLSSKGTYAFSPYEDVIFSPTLYGLDTLEINELSALAHTPAATLSSPRRDRHKKSYEIRISRAFVRNTVATVAAVFLFFYLSTPIENTYVERANYAQLLPADLFEKIEGQSLLTSLVGATTVVEHDMAEEESVATTEEVSEVNATPVAESKSKASEPVQQSTPAVPITVKEIKVPKAATETTSASAAPKQTKKPYHIIVASVAFKDDAQVVVNDLKAKGYADACVLTDGGRVRISLMSYPTREEANIQLTELRKDNAYQNAWLLAR